MSIIIEAITQQHDRKAFDCGTEKLNQFLQQQARHMGEGYKANIKNLCSLPKLLTPYNYRLSHTKN